LDWYDPIVHITAGVILQLEDPMSNHFQELLETKRERCICPSFIAGDTLPYGLME